MANTTDEPLPQLFTGMTFYIRPCSIRRSIHILVKKHGGEFSRVRKATTIVLTEVLEHTTGYHTDFIHDSIKNKKLQPQEKYKLPAYNSTISVDNHIIKMPASLLNKARQRYSPAEDNAIAKYIAQYASSKDKVGSINGNVIWREMERKKVTVHSWQSMKDRYINHIQHCPPKFKYAALDVCGGGAVASSDGKRMVVVDSISADEKGVENRCDKTPIANGSSCPLPAPATGDDKTGNTDTSKLTRLPDPITYSSSIETNTSTDNSKLSSSPYPVASSVTARNADSSSMCKLPSAVSVSDIGDNATTGTPSAVSVSDIGDNTTTGTPSAISVSDIGDNIATGTPSAVSESDVGDNRLTDNVEHSKSSCPPPVNVLCDDRTTKNTSSLARNSLSGPPPSSLLGEDKATEHTDNSSAPETLATSVDSKTTVVSANDAPISVKAAKESRTDGQQCGDATSNCATPPIVTTVCHSVQHKCVGNILNNTMAKIGGESKKVVTGTAGSIERMKNDTETNTMKLFEPVQSNEVDFISENVHGQSGHNLLTHIQSEENHNQEAVAVDTSSDANFKQKDGSTLFTESEDESDDSADEDDDLDKTLLKEAIKVATGDDGLLDEVSFAEDLPSQQHGYCECYEQVDSSRALKLKEHIESIPGNDPAWISVRNELIMRDIGLKYGLSGVEVKEILLMSKT